MTTTLYVMLLTLLGCVVVLVALATGFIVWVLLGPVRFKVKQSGLSAAPRPTGVTDQQYAKRIAEEMVKNYQERKDVRPS